MANRFANGRKAFAFCDRCGFRFDLKKLKNEVVKTKQTQIKSCPACWSADHPQLQLGMFPVSDPQAIRDPRPDTNTWYQSGTNGLQLDNTSGTGPNQDGFPGEGMLVTQWGWNPIGGARDFTDPLTPNALVGVGQVGQVTIGSTGTPAFTLVEVLYTTPGTYSWTAPTGITSIYVLCIGGGGAGGTGFNVTGGTSEFSSLINATGGGANQGFGGAGTALSTTVFGGNGGRGGSRTGTSGFGGGGGGAGGYAGNGGNGASSGAIVIGASGAGGAAAGGNYEIGGGGVGLNGLGASGLASGQGGSGGTAGTASGAGLYGGGGRGRGFSFPNSALSGGGGGGLRWSPNISVTPNTAYTVIVGAGGGTGVTQGGSGAVKIAYWQPIP